MQENKQIIIDFINRSERILILPSAPVDGDSIGSALALHLALKKIGKKSTVVCQDSVPEVLKFLPHISSITNKLISNNDFVITINKNAFEIEKIKSELDGDQVKIIVSPKSTELKESDFSIGKSNAGYDLIITVDTAELSQLKDVYEQNTELFTTIPVINIDHHVSNQHFGKINHVDVMSSSTTELILSLLESLSRQTNTQLIDKDIATLLLTGIITDTGSFQNANTNPRSFDQAAKLVEYGARQQEIIRYVYKTKQLSQLKLWGRILSKIKIDDEHRIVWSTVTQQDFRDTGSTLEETGDVIDELMTNAPGAEIIILLKEKENGEVKGSIRTTSAAVDGESIAKQFGGGGHTQASGFLIKEKGIMDAEFRVVSAAKEYQAKRLNLKTEDYSNEEFIDAISKKVATSNISELVKDVEVPSIEPETLYKFED